MNDSRVNGLAAAAAGVALTSMLAFGSLAADGLRSAAGFRVGPLAQIDAPAPRRLLPRKRVEPESSESMAPEPEEKQSAREVRPGIEVNRLQGPDPQDFGTIDQLSGGFARNLWDGSTESLVAHLMGQLPDAITSPTIRDVLRRLLLTGAAPPVRDNAQEDVNLAALRVSRLQAMGLLGSASTLLEVAPNRGSDDSLLRLHAENLLTRDDVAGACADTGLSGINLADRYWQQLLIFCQIVDGNFDEASLGAGLLAESNDPVDPLFTSLVDGFFGGTMPTVERLDSPSPLLLAMLRYAKLPFPANSLEQATPPLLAMVAASPQSDLDLRLAAAEQAVRFGAMTKDRLTSIYSSAPFSGEDLGNALSTAEATRSPRGRALLYRAAASHDVPTARAEVLLKALAFAKDDGVYAFSIKLYRQMIETMTPSAELSWFAADAAHALYALGRGELAKPWLVGLRFETVRDPAAKLALESLWALATLTSAADPIGEAPGSIDTWRSAVATLEPQLAELRIKDATALLAIQGHQIDTDRWRTLLGTFEMRPARLPDFAYRSALAAAAQSGRFGEAVLLASIIVGRDGPADLDFSVLNEVVGAFRSIGLDEEAQALIVEVAVGKRI